MYKLLAVDIDGTLVDKDLVIRAGTRQVLLQCKEKGLVVTLATGRMFQSALPYASRLGIDVPLITYNGALVKDSGSGEVYHHRTIPLTLARKVLRLAKESGLQLNVFIDDEYYVEEYNDWAKTYEEIAGVKANVVGDMEGFMKREPTKFIISDEPEDMDTYIQDLERILGDELYLTRSRPFFLEILHPQVSKVEGLQVLGSRFGIELKEMVVIGDSYNDVEMLKAAGLGIAMGNAPPAVQEVADWVTGRIQEEGLVTAVRRFLLSE